METMAVALDRNRFLPYYKGSLIFNNVRVMRFFRCPMRALKTGSKIKTIISEPTKRHIL